jgi:hypothetical protein
MVWVLLAVGLVVTSCDLGRARFVTMPSTTTVTAPTTTSSLEAVSTTTLDPWPARAVSEDKLAAAVKEGVGAAVRHGGSVEAGVWLDGAPTPTIVGDVGAGRVWSLSKPVAAVALLEKTSGLLEPDVVSAMSDAIVQSSNCGQRRVIVELQARSGGIDQAEAAFNDVLRRAGVTITTRPQRATADADPTCRAYLQSHRSPGVNPFGLALQFGTDSWRLRDALSFAHALSTGVYGSAGQRVLQLMREPKTRAAESHPGDYTAPLNAPPSGGTFPAGWTAAYKGGWGGRTMTPPDYRATQIIVLRVAGHGLAVAATFRPSTPPASDDPGRSAAPAALAAVFSSVQRSLIDLSTPRAPSTTSTVRLSSTTTARRPR